MLSNTAWSVRSFSQSCINFAIALLTLYHEILLARRDFWVKFPTPDGNDPVGDSPPPRPPGPWRPCRRQKLCQIAQVVRDSAHNSSFLPPSLHSAASYSTALHRNGIWILACTDIGGRGGEPRRRESVIVARCRPNSYG